MKLRILRDLFVLVALFGVIWILFIYNPLWVDGKDLRMSYEKEAELAEYLEKISFDKFKEVEDTIVVDAINKITDRLLSTLDTSKYDYDFKVITNEEKNAFATLNGNVYIFSGIIKFVESPEELAMILAHEIGHVEKRHVVDKITQKLGIEALFAILNGGDPVLLSEVSKLLVSTSFDRKKEAEADDFAYKLALNSKLNPRRLAQFFIRVLGEGNQTDLIILNTHPHSSKRVQSASEVELPAGFEEVEFDINWESVQLAL
ncbi:MAG: M48 family metallopeptidase [Cyclobacteriaceae bacterium]